MRNVTNAARLSSIAKLRNKSEELEQIQRRIARDLLDRGIDIDNIPEGTRQLLAEYFTARNEQSMVNKFADDLEHIEHDSQAQSMEINSFEAKALIEKQLLQEEQWRNQTAQEQKAAADKQYAEAKSYTEAEENMER